MLTSRTKALPVAALLAALAVAASPSLASAAQRYASPSGAGAGCTSANPCAFEDAVKIAVAGDEVIASPGDYALASTVEDKAEITLRGVAGQPRPRLLFSGPNQAGLRLMHGSLLRDMEIEQAAAVAAVTTSGARLDRVVVKGGGGISDCPVNIMNGIVRDTVVVAAVNPICSFGYPTPNTSAYRNVTAVATQPGSAAIVVSAPTGVANVELRNVIARGGAGGPGFSILTDVPGGQATVTATHSNFENWGQYGANTKFIDGGGNQHAPPTFVNAAGSDYREAAGSVTIDSGVNEPLNGAFDVDGDVRRIGTTDIGADEFVPPPVVATGPADGIGAQSVTLAGSVTGIGVPTSYHFEYGPTTAYASATPASGLSLGLGAIPVAATLDGLRPGTTYHYRLVASNKGGLGQGQDRTFTTAASVPSSSPSGSSPAPAFPGVRLVSTRLALSSKSVTLKLSCPAGTVGGCSGTAKLSARSRHGTRRVSLGKARFSMAAGDTSRVRVKFSRAGRRRLKGVRRLRARDVNAAHDGTGVWKTTAAAVSLRRVVAR